MSIVNAQLKSQASNVLILYWCGLEGQESQESLIGLTAKVTTMDKRYFGPYGWGDSLMLGDRMGIVPNLTIVIEVSSMFHIRDYIICIVFLLHWLAYLFICLPLWEALLLVYFDISLSILASYQSQTFRGAE